MGTLKTVGAVLALGTSTLFLTGCGGGDAALPASPAPSAVAEPPSPAAVPRGGALVDFEHLSPGEGVFSEGADVGVIGGVPAAIRTAGGEVTGVSAVEGREPSSVALQFPESCDGKDCGKLIVEIPPAAAPTFTGRVRFGAVFKMTPEQTAAGSNVLQRGFATGDRGQWKLQVDGDEGVPSCVVIPGGGDTFVVRGETGVADGGWHEVACERVGDTLSIIVDGQTEGSVPVSRPLVVAPEGPIRIGGKNVKPDNDQFFGAVDEVFFETS